MYLYKTLTIICAFLFNICCLFANNSDDVLELEYPITNFTTKDGLPSNESFCILQDSRGYIWIGTDRGLVKYDGYEFVTYTTLDGLTDNVILALKEDDLGNIWYTGLNNVQIGYIDKNMIFHTYKYYNKVKEEIDKLNYIRIHFNEIYIDGDDKYLVNNNYGYIVINSNGIKYVDIIPNGLPRNGSDMKLVENDKFSFIYSYLGHFYWTNRPIRLFNESNEHIYTYNKRELRYLSPRLIKQDSIVRIYDGIDYLSIKNGRITHDTLGFLCKAFKISEHQFLYSTYNVNTNQRDLYYSISSDFNAPKIKLKGNTRAVNAIRDRNGGIWIATLRKGILYIPGLNTLSTKSKDPIEIVCPIDEHIIIEINNREYKYDIKTRNLSNENDVTKISEFRKVQGKFAFIGAIRAGLELKGTEYFSEEQRLKGIQTISDTLTYLWSVGYIYKIKHTKIKDNLEWKRVRWNLSYQESLYCFKEDSCLYGTRDGFYLYLNDTIINLHEEVNKSIRHLEYFKQSEVLVYTILGEGLILKYKDGKKIRLTKEEGLVSNTINALFMDSSNVLWIGTNQGVNTLTIDQNNEIELETVLHTSKQISSPNILQIYTQDSILYLGTDAGFNIVDLRVKDKQKEIPICLGGVNVNDVVYNLKKEENLVLRYDSNNVTFHYTAIALNMYGEINYRYKLEGLSEEWIYTNERKATFLQLNSGTYKFYLEVQNELGEWVGSNYTVQIIIKKAYWKTWWFISGIALIVISVIGGALYYYISNLKKEKDFIEDKQILTEELNESRQKALNAQLNPHFVFNSLNSIQNFILTKRTELSSDYLSMFSKLMRFVFENSRKLYVPLADEIEALRLYLELEQVRHNNQFQFRIESHNLQTHHFSIPSLLIQPIIENAIWHGLLHKTGGDKTLEVSFKTKEEYLIITVKDNGVGRNKSKPRPKLIKKQKSSGVELTIQRLDLLSQSLELTTNFEIIDLFDANNTPCGTKVIITIPLIISGQHLP